DANMLFHVLLKGKPTAGTPARTHVNDLESEFRELVRQWREDTKYTSSATDAAMHPAYQRIIGMGPAVLPHVLRELHETPGHWFWALRAITGENPVRPEDQGHVVAMRDAWIDWARKHDLIAQW